MLNLHRDIIQKASTGECGKIPRDHMQDGNVAVGGIGNLAG